MPPRPAIVARALAEATARPSREQGGSGYPPPFLADHEVTSRRARAYSQVLRQYPAMHAARLACSRLGQLRAARRTGLVIATSAADRQAVARIPGAFKAPCEAGSLNGRRLDVLLAVSRFLSGSLAQDVATMLGTGGPELCVPGDCGVAPLALAALFIDSGRADAMVVVAVDPRADDPARYEAVAVVIDRTPTTGHAVPPPSAEMTKGAVACVPAIRDYLSRAPVAAGTAPDASVRHSVRRGAGRCVVRWAAQAESGASAHDGPDGPDGPDGWLDGGRKLLDECVRVAGTTELGVVSASFAGLSPEHALHAIERGAAPDEVARQARRTTFEDVLRRHAADRVLRGPYVTVTGIPGASLLALAIAQDLIETAAVPAVAIVAGDWMGAGAARALGALGCPERPHLRSSMSALVLGRGDGDRGARGVRSFVARRGACDEFTAELLAHAPAVAMASGCTTADLDAARHFIAPPHSPASRAGRFLGADALVCLADLLDQPGRAALSIRNELGGSGLVLLDAVR